MEHQQEVRRPGPEASARPRASILAAEGFDAVIGPMDGDTWHRYRVVTESDGSPPYLLEPVSDDKRAEVEAAALERAGSQTVDNLRARVRRALARLRKSMPEGSDLHA